ncbi:MAG: 6-phosphogluconolactonase [Candidatus Hydrogenedentes bacterium]|nr:6-phosphogluconolactonase [Candidatus Hydrogenedentota bacterium]
MQIDVLPTQQDVNQLACSMILGELDRKPNLLFCAATGSSPAGAYRAMGEAAKANPTIFSRMRLLKLDEWGGLPMDHPGTCEHYLREYLVKPLSIDEARYFGFQSAPSSPEAECERMRAQLNELGPIDVCVLGLGLNGHLGMNEPAATLSPNCHVAELTPTAMGHSMLAGGKPHYGLTLGMADILQSRLILLLNLGASKREPMRRFLTQRIDTDFPGSLLWTHPNTIILCDRDAHPE